MAKKIINADKDKLLQYKYTIKEFFIIIKGKTTKYPVERVSSFSIEHFYEDATFPIFKVVVNMGDDLYYKILKNKNKTKFKVRIQYYTTNALSEKDSIKKDLINETFVIFTDDDNSNYNIDLDKEASKQSGDEVLDVLNNPKELFLFKDSIVRKMRKPHNAILKDVNMTTALAYLLKEAGAKKVLLSPIENRTKYKQIVLPPQSIEKQIKYLNNNYGFHKKGTVVYFDFKYGYIINYKKGCTAWTKKEKKSTVIYVLKRNNNISIKSCAVKKPKNKNKYILNVVPEGIHIENNTVSTNVLYGVDPTVINTKRPKDIKNIKSKAKVTGEAINTIMVNDTSNKYMGSVYAAQRYADNTVITITIDDIDINAFNPNKDISIIFENGSLSKKYKGHYRVARVAYVFGLIGTGYKVNAVAVLKRTK